MKKMLATKKNEKGFTLMEMLIVVAIIAVLVAIMIPAVTSSLNKAKESADMANIRSYYAECMVAYLNDDDTTYGAMSADYISGDVYGYPKLNFSGNKTWTRPTNTEEGSIKYTCTYTKDGETAKTLEYKLPAMRSST